MTPPGLMLCDEDDIENQKAARIAKQVDPFGLRTIGEPHATQVSVTLSGVD